MKILKNSFKAIKYYWNKGAVDKKAKKDEKKAKIRSMPPQYHYYRIGKFLFWGFQVILLLLLFIIISNISKGGEEDSEKKVELPPPNQATMQPAVEFGKEFTSKYLTFSSKEDNGDRSKKLKPYLVKELSDTTGISIDEGKDIETSVKSVDLKKVEEAGKNKGLLTFKAKVEQTEYVTKTVDKKVKDGKKTKTVKEEVREPKKKEVTRFITIPTLYKDGKYAVYELPKFTNVDENESVSYSENNKLQSTSENKGKVKDFLNTFFEVYASESKDKIEYMLDNNVDVKTLNGNLKFSRIVDLETFKSNAGNETVVKTNVEFKDDIGVTYTSTYHINLKAKDNRFIVTKFEEQ
ncbi:conjugal transfer protein [Mammaliicoccus sciuri]|uniref:conjugal transfer protein n=1 Tax=Mammaliicoccus sciuri TaxID=1296 RepID=UPI002737ACF2|nr:conjugal transfer protein [Mammaliicoccus sciuri]